MLTVKEASEKYGVSDTVIRKWITSKVLPSSFEIINLRRVYVVDEEDIERFLTRRYGDIHSFKKQKPKRITNSQLKELKTLLVAIDKMLAEITSSEEEIGL